MRAVDPGDIHSRRHEPRHERWVIGGRARQRHHDPRLAVFGGATQQRRGVHTQGSGDRGPPLRSGFLPVCRRALPQSGVDRAQDGIKVVQHIGFHAPERREPLGCQTILEVAQIPRPQGDIADEVGGAGGMDRVHPGEGSGCRPFGLFSCRSERHQFGAKGNEPL